MPKKAVRPAVAARKASANPASAKPNPQPETRRMHFSSRNPAQRHFQEAIQKCDLSFGIGPAGTGKTFVAVAMAVKAYQEKRVSRIVMLRPAVEAGERLGYLPGTPEEKVGPYLAPLLDSLCQLLPPGALESMRKSNALEIAPLAYLRGRTFRDAFILVDEAQNTSIEQMLMITTRLGMGSKMVINGDPEQADLPRHVKSGLLYAQEAFSQIDGIGFCEFTGEDVVRHPLVSEIVAAHKAWKEGR